MSSVTVPILPITDPVQAQLFPLLLSGCQRCDTMPGKLEGPGTLHLRFPLTHTLGKMLSFLSQNNFGFTNDNGLLGIEVQDTDLTNLAQTLSKLLTPLEQHDVHAIFQQKGHILQMSDLMGVQSLTHFIARAQIAWLIDMVAHERLTTVFQPIVDTKSGEIFAYEGLLRGIEDEKYVSPARIFEVAKGAGLLFQIDLAARRSAIRNAAIHGIQNKVFINFTPTAIYDPANCLRSTAALIDECKLQAEQIVFEVIESEQVNDIPHLIGILDYYRSKGFGVALDDLGAGYSSLNLLVALRPDYVKLDRELISGVHLDAYKAIIAGKLLETANSLGIKTIAEGVETIEEMQWLRQNGADYMQGYLFARPNLPPPLASFPTQ